MACVRARRSIDSVLAFVPSNHHNASAHIYNMLSFDANLILPIDSRSPTTGTGHPTPESRTHPPPSSHRHHPIPIPSPPHTPTLFINHAAGRDLHAVHVQGRISRPDGRRGACSGGLPPQSIDAMYTCGLDEALGWVSMSQPTHPTTRIHPSTHRTTTPLTPPPPHADGDEEPRRGARGAHHCHRQAPVRVFLYYLYLVYPMDVSVYVCRVWDVGG